LQQLCGGDVKLYDVLSSSLYLDPIAGLPKEDLGILTEAVEKSVKDEDYEEAIRLYRSAVDKAIFEATQHQEEKDRYIKVIQDLVSKRARATEKLKEKAEKEGLTDRVAALERGTEDSKFLSERIEDVLEVASHFYGERLKTMGEKEREEGRLQEKRKRSKRGQRRGARKAKRKGDRGNEKKKDTGNKKIIRDYFWSEAYYCLSHFLLFYGYGLRHASADEGRNDKKFRCRQDSRGNFRGQGDSTWQRRLVGRL